MNILDTTTLATESRFLTGLFAPVTEEITAFDLPVTGRLPPELNGRYLRNGPNPMSLADPNYHWFVGAGMVHGVRLRNGRAEWYRNRWVRSKDVAESLGEKWKSGPIHNEIDFPANTHIICHAGHTLATVEAGPLPYELTDELDTIGPCDFSGTLPAGFAAHTKVDRRTGELHAIAYSPWESPVATRSPSGAQATLTNAQQRPLNSMAPTCTKEPRNSPPTRRSISGSSCRCIL